MPDRMENGTQVQCNIGIDLCEDYSQISYMLGDSMEPKSISTTTGEQKFQIPTVLFQKGPKERWHFGEEAIRLSLKSEGILIPKLIELCRKQVPVKVNEEEYEPYQLLSIYLRKLFGLLTFEGVKDQAYSVITVTLIEDDAVLRDAVKKAIEEAAISYQKLRIEDHRESFFHYVLSMPKELYEKDVVLIEYGEAILKSFHLSIREDTLPRLVSIREKGLKELIPFRDLKKENFSKEKKEKLDLLFLDQCKELLQQHSVSAIFLVGDGFEYGWANQTIHYLCNKRRVFQGKNLYCKGACYASHLKKESEELTDYLYLNHNKVKYNIGLPIIKQGKQEIFTLLSAGVDWFLAKTECEVLLDCVDSIELKMISIEGEENRTILIPLSDLPNRPNKTIRLGLELFFESEKKAKIVITEIGFGEFFRATNKTWEHEILL